MATQLLQQHVLVDDLVNLIGSYLMVSAESVAELKQYVLNEFMQQMHFKPMPLNFNDNPELALPVIAIAYQDLRVNITLRSTEDLIWRLTEDIMEID